MRHVPHRLFLWVVDGLVCIDQFIGWWLRGWGYVWFNTERPNPDETISSWVGRNAVAGHMWALIAEVIIDTIFFWNPDHCRKAVGH
jgi:hypothetical protein